MEDELYNPRSGNRTIPPLVRYFVSVAGTEDHSGPFTLAQLQGSWRRGTIDPESLVWKEGTEEWIPVKQLQDQLDPPSFEEYLASPRAGGKDKIRRHRQKKRRSTKADFSTDDSNTKRRAASKRSAKNSHNRSRDKPTLLHLVAIVLILILAMAGVAGMILALGKIL